MKKFAISAILILEALSLMACTKTIESTTTESLSSTLDIVSTTTEISSISSETTTQKQKYFKEVVMPEEVLINETNIFSFVETNEGTIKKNFNPFKSTSFSIDAYFVSESGKTYSRPAYWTQDYSSKLNTLIKRDPVVFTDEIQGQDTVNAEGVEHFNVSFMPIEPGTYTYRFEVFANNVQVEVYKGEFNVNESSEVYKGKIVVNDTNERYFMYENTKETYIPIGLNDAWYSSSYRKSYDYDEWFKRQSNVGINVTRIWLASWSFGLHIGSGSKVDDFSGRLNQAFRLERVLKLAQEKGIYVMLTLNNHGQFSTTVNAEWDINSYNTLVDAPYKFFSDSKCKETYKEELRYIIARYGTYDSILSWELFNEVDWVDASAVYDTKIKEWHKEMAQYIKSIDCYQRMITTSYKGNGGSASSLDEIDFSCIHSYSYTNNNPITYTTTEINQNYNKYKKLVMFAEWGVNADSGDGTHTIDPNGISLYQSLWSSLLTGGAGSTMCWWWDQYIHKFDLYHLYEGISKFSKYMDLSGEIKYLNDTNVQLELPLKFIGVKAENRIYGYIYDKNYTRSNPNESVFNSTIKFSLENGTYSITFINPKTGDVIKEDTITITNGEVNYSLPSFKNDLAIIIN